MLECHPLDILLVPVGITAAKQSDKTIILQCLTKKRCYQCISVSFSGKAYCEAGYGGYIICKISYSYERNNKQL